MRVSEIKPYEKNAKKHPKKQVEQVAKSIKSFGFNQPIVVDKNNVVIVGHGRLEAAKFLNLEDVPVITVDLTP
jgi:ParB-like chromosome segregation protein Spo0J